MLDNNLLVKMRFKASDLEKPSDHFFVMVITLNEIEQLFRRKIN